MTGYLRRQLGEAESIAIIGRVNLFFLLKPCPVVREGSKLERGSGDRTPARREVAKLVRAKSNEINFVEIGPRTVLKSVRNLHRGTNADGRADDGFVPIAMLARSFNAGSLQSPWSLWSRDAKNS